MRFSKRLRPRLSYANVMSSAAVFLVLGGVAVALPGRNTVNSGDIINDTVKSADIRDGGIKARDVKTGQLTRRLGGLRAYAEVVGAGVTEANSSGIADAQVSNPSAGVWCIDLSFTPKHVQATGQAQGGGDDVAMAELSPGLCPAGTDVELRNFDISAGAPANDTVFVAVW